MTLFRFRMRNLWDLREFTITVGYDRILLSIYFVKMSKNGRHVNDFILHDQAHTNRLIYICIENDIPSTVIEKLSVNEFSSIFHKPANSCRTVYPSGSAFFSPITIISFSATTQHLQPMIITLLLGT